MTNSSFVSTKLYQPREFVVPRSLRRRVLLGLRWLATPRAFTLGALHPRFREQAHASANSWRKVNNVGPSARCAVKRRIER